MELGPTITERRPRMHILRSRLVTVTCFATLFSLLLIAAIPALCLSAGNNLALMIVSIVVLVGSAAAVPLLWIRFAKLISLRGVTAAIERDKVYEADAIALCLSLSRRKVNRRIKRILHWHILRGYFFDGKLIHPTYRLGASHEITCPSCGQSFRDTEAPDDICPFCRKSLLD